MSEAAGVAPIRARLSMDSRMASLEGEVRQNRSDMTEQHRDLKASIENLSKRVGSPGDEAEHATGLFKKFDDLDNRVRPFEILKHQVIGAIKACLPLSCGFGLILWFLEGDKLKLFFAGHS